MNIELWQLKKYYYYKKKSEKLKKKNLKLMAMSR